jgi:hypothetical protein
MNDLMKKHIGDGIPVTVVLPPKPVGKVGGSHSHADGISIGVTGEKATGKVVQVEKFNHKTGKREIIYEDAKYRTFKKAHGIKDNI